MPTPYWIAHIRAEGMVRASFEEWINKHIKRHRDAINTYLLAGDLSGAQLELGKEQALEALLSEIRAYDREVMQRGILEKETTTDYDRQRQKGD